MHAQPPRRIPTVCARRRGRRALQVPSSVQELREALNSYQYVHLKSRDPRRRIVRTHGPSKPFFPRLLRFPPIFQYLLEPAFGFWALECDVLTSLRARKAYRIHV